MTSTVETSALNEIDLRYAKEDWSALCVRYLLSALEARLPVMSVEHRKCHAAAHAVFFQGRGGQEELMIWRRALAEEEASGGSDFERRSRAALWACLFLEEDYWPLPSVLLSHLDALAEALGVSLVARRRILREVFSDTAIDLGGLLEAADAAAAAQGDAPAPLGETSGAVAALVTPEGAMTITPSIAYGGLNELTGSLTGLLARIPVEERSRVHGQCCEIAALSELETTGGTPEGAAISVSLTGGQAEGLSIPICSSCRRIGAELGLKKESLEDSRSG